MNLAELKPQLIKIVKPPIPQKPKPKKKEPPPPPPKQKPPPKLKPLKQIKPPPPRPRPRPQRPQPAPLHRVAVATTHNVHAVSPIAVPDTAPNTDQRPTASGESPQPTPPAPAPPPPAPPAPAPPAPTPAPPPPAPVVVKPKPPPPPPPPPPKPTIPDRDEPELKGSFSDFDLPQFDANNLNTASVTVTWDVDARGHPSNIKFRPTGNSDVDEAIRNAIQKYRFKPAVHNGVAETAIMSHTFNLSN